MAFGSKILFKRVLSVVIGGAAGGGAAAVNDCIAGMPDITNPQTALQVILYAVGAWLMMETRAPKDEPKGPADSIDFDEPRRRTGSRSGE